MRNTIIIKNHFNRIPMSRSQAKELCVLMEKLQEVELDFNDIEWMGQGFAHQLFVVFANEHPDIKLIPINMNEDISKMYVHVKQGL